MLCFVELSYSGEPGDNMEHCKMTLKRKMKLSLVGWDVQMVPPCFFGEELKQHAASSEEDIMDAQTWQCCDTT